MRRAQHARPPFKEAPTNSERRAEALAYEVEEEVTANGRRRGTFVRKGLRPAPRRMHPPQACLRPDSPRTEGPRRDRQGPGQMSPGAGRWPSPPPLLCPGPCPPRRGSASGEEITALAAAFQGGAGELRTPGGGPCVRSKGGGDGQRPAPEDIRTQGPPPGATQNEPAARDAGRAQRPRPPCQCSCHAWNINTFHRCVCHLRSPRTNASQMPRTRAASKQP